MPPKNLHKLTSKEQIELDRQEEAKKLLDQEETESVYSGPTHLTDSEKKEAVSDPVLTLRFVADRTIVIDGQKVEFKKDHVIDSANYDISFLKSRGANLDVIDENGDVIVNLSEVGEI